MVANNPFTVEGVGCDASAGEPAVGGRARDAVLPIIAGVCLWFLAQRGILTTPFEVVRGLDADFGSLATVACVVLAAGVLGTGWGPLWRLLADRRAVLATGIAGGAAVLAGTSLLGLLPEGFAPAVAIACMIAEAVAYCTLFLAWCQVFGLQTRTAGLSRTLLSQLLAVVVSIGVSQISPLVVIGGVQPLYVAAFPVMGACFFAWDRSVAARGGLRAWDCSADVRLPGSGQAARDALWMVFTGLAFFFVGLLSYLPHLNMTAEKGVEDALTIGFTVMFLVPLVLLCLRAGRVTSGLDKGLAVALLVVTLVILAAFFTLMLSMFGDLEIQYSLARFVRRASRIVMFLFILLVVYRVGFHPVRCFAYAFLVPMYLPKCIVCAINLALPAASVFANGKAVLFVLSMALTVCLVAILFLNFDGGLVRQMAGRDGGGEGVGDPPDRRCEACRKIATEVGLTDREREILLLFSRGYSIAKTCDELSISRGTVNTHSSALYRKLGVHSKQEVIELVNARL